jgi:HK97 family phage major capsid protein
MPPTVKTIQDELTEAHERIKGILATAEREDRELTDEEDAAVKDSTARMEALNAKRARTDARAGILATVGALAPKTNGHTPAALPPAPAAPAPATRGANGILGFLNRLDIGTQFTEAEAMRNFLAQPRTGQWASPTIEIEAAAPFVTVTPAVIPPGVIIQPPPPVYPWDLVSSRFGQGTTDAGSIPYLMETGFTNAADYVAMGAAKPGSAKDFTLASATLLKIAHYLKVPDELLDDVAGLRSFIDANLIGGLVEKLENEVINGTGAAGHIQGLIGLAGKTTNVVASVNEPKAVAIARAAANVWVNSKRRPDTVVLDPVTYINVAYQVSPNFFVFPGGITPLAGLTPVQSPPMPADQALVGAFQQGAMLFRKGGIALQATNSDQDDFIKNLTTIRAEMRVALVYWVPAAFCLVTGLTAPALT